MKHVNSLYLLLCLCFFNVQSHDQANSGDISSVLNELEISQVKYIDFMFTDLLGALRSVTLPLSKAKSALKHGLKFDGSSVPGCSTIYESDMHLKPNLNTCVVIGNALPTARIFCDVYRSEQEPYEADPRYLLQQQLLRAHELGFEFLIGPELEFFLFEPDTKNKLQPIDSERYFEADHTLEKEWKKLCLLEDLISNHVNVEKIHHEVAPGQHEISIEYDNALRMADQIVVAQHVIKTFAQAQDMKATFMPKPLFGTNGSGMHVHFSLYDTKNDRNAFYDKEDELYLSATARHFIAGVLQYVPEINAFLNSTVNSYKRLVAGYEAPVYICWATQNRSALIRIPQINVSQPRASRAELRSPDALSNPYILFTLLLAAGLDGIEQKMDLPQAVNENLYKMSLSEIQRRGIATLPASLEHAVAALQRSNFARKILGNRLVDEFLAIKNKEIAAYNRAVTNWEIEHYL